MKYEHLCLMKDLSLKMLFLRYEEDSESNSSLK